MSDLKTYEVDVNGYRTAFLYSDEDAKRLGLTGKDAESVAAKHEAKAVADAKAAEAAQKEAADKAAAEKAAADAAEADKAKTTAKESPAPANKAAAAPSNK